MTAFAPPKIAVAARDKVHDRRFGMVETLGRHRENVR